MYDQITSPISNKSVHSEVFRTISNILHVTSQYLRFFLPDKIVFRESVQSLAYSCKAADILQRQITQYSNDKFLRKIQQHLLKILEQTQSLLHNFRILKVCCEFPKQAYVWCQLGMRMWLQWWSVSLAPWTFQPNGTAQIPGSGRFRQILPNMPNVKEVRVLRTLSRKWGRFGLESLKEKEDACSWTTKKEATPRSVSEHQQTQIWFNNPKLQATPLIDRSKFFLPCSFAFCLGLVWFGLVWLIGWLIAWNVVQGHLIPSSILHLHSNKFCC